MIDKGVINIKLNEIISSIREAQLDDGSFLSISAPIKDFSADSYDYKSPFAVSLVILALADLPEAQEIVKKSSQYLIKQINENYTVNYYEKDSDLYNRFKFPDDLDCTFCAHLAISQANANYMSGDIMAGLAKILTLYEIQEGGPYKTWVVPEDADKPWKDVDLVVNANIQYFLSKQEVILPNLQEYLEQAVINKDISSPYYCSDFASLYFAARAYFKENKNELADLIDDKINRIGITSMNVLDKAFALSALLTLDSDSDKSELLFADLVSMPINEINKPIAYVVDPAMDGKQYFGGCKALTMAIFVQALNLYNLNKQSDDAAEMTDQKSVYYNNIIQETKELFLEVGNEVAGAMQKRLEILISYDHDGQIVLLPKYVHDSMDFNDNPIDDVVKSLCQANLLGWLAYSLFDDFFDEEGEPVNLSLAIISLRLCVSIFEQTSARHPAFKDVYVKVMNKIDKANLWEVKNCRFNIVDGVLDLQQSLPAYSNGRFSDRSLGHALGACALFIINGYERELDDLLLFFKHYLAVRQMQDDMHDWEEDLQKGIINSVHAQLFSDWRNEYNKEKINLDEDISLLQTIFWNKTVESSCEHAQQELDKAERVLADLEALNDKSFLKKMLSATRTSINETLHQRDEVLKFINAYK